MVFKTARVGSIPAILVYLKMRYKYLKTLKPLKLSINKYSYSSKAVAVKFLSRKLFLKNNKPLKPYSFYVDSKNIVLKPLYLNKKEYLNFVLTYICNFKNTRPWSFNSSDLRLIKFKNSQNFQYKQSLCFQPYYLVNKPLNIKNLDNNKQYNRHKITTVKNLILENTPTYNQYYWNIVQYLTNLRTLKLRNLTKISLTRVSRDSFIRNSSFFSDMNSWQFTKIKQKKFNLLRSSSFNFDILTGLGSINSLPRHSFISNITEFYKHLYTLQEAHPSAGNMWSNKPVNNKFILYKSLKMLKKKIKLNLLKRKITNKTNYYIKPYKSQKLKRNTSLSFFTQNSKNLLKRRLANYSFKNKYLNLKTIESISLSDTYFSQTHNVDTQSNLSQQYRTLETNFLTKHLLKSKSKNTNVSLYNYLVTVSNPLLFKLNLAATINSKITLSTFDSMVVNERNLNLMNLELFNNNNLLPSKSFKKIVTKQAFDFFSSYKFYENIIPWYHNTLIRFFEHVSGLKSLLQIYPFINQNITYDWIIRYRSWMPRMAFYERMLGHKFFLEEALHIIHLSFYYKDSKLFSSWLKAIILRISFWKTRSIFRFLKYLMINHFYYVFNELGIKGLKIRLKGKISVAGNSRKRSILYRVGQTSYSQVSLRVSHHKTTINTFTGVMGFQVWLFY